MDKAALYRDASNRLCFSTSDVSFIDYPSVCSKLCEALGLLPHGNLITDAASVIFRDYRRDQQTVEVAWDNWMGFAVTAKTPESEPLVKECANWTIARTPLEH